MKTQYKHIKNIINISLFTIISLVITPSHTQATTIYEANDWYSSTTMPGTGIVDGDTNNPTLKYVATDKSIGGIFSYFTPSSTPIILEDGMTLTLNTIIQVRYNVSDATPNENVEFRFGIFDSSTATRAESTQDIGSRRVKTDLNIINNWTGFFISSSPLGSKIYRRNSQNSGSYTSTNGTSNVTLDPGHSGGVTFEYLTDMELTLSLNRSGNDLYVSGALGSDSFSGTYVNAFTGGYPATFDTIAFFTAGDIVTTGRVYEVRFIDTNLTLIPEPSSLALLISGMGSILLFRRKKRYLH